MGRAMQVILKECLNGIPIELQIDAMSMKTVITLQDGRGS